MALTTFTRNYADRSSDKGYQFEFYCDQCGSGLRSAFQTSKLSVAAGLLRAASSLIGGRFGAAAQSADYVKDALRGGGWDDAYSEAVEEAKPRFRQCPGCGHWVCLDACWQEAAQRCDACASTASAEVVAPLAPQPAGPPGQRPAGGDPGGTAGAAGDPAGTTCPSCQTPVSARTKFCPECGSSLAGVFSCARCGGVFATPGKFCPECGQPRPAAG